MTTHLRTVHLTAHDGVRYTLTMRDSGEIDWRGQTLISYALEMRTPERGPCETETLFEASDYSGSPMHADDSDDSVRGLLAFLTVKPGDTDREYFSSYSPRQLEWCEAHAEYLGYAVSDMFGDE